MQKRPKPENEQDESGKPRPGTERARDEQRDGGPRYAGEPWKVADERGDQRFGQARIDDSDPSELPPEERAADDDEWPGHDAVPQDGPVPSDDGATESGGQHAGVFRGEKPQKSKSRTKKNPKPNIKRKTGR